MGESAYGIYNFSRYNNKHLIYFNEEELKGCVKMGLIEKNNVVYFTFDSFEKFDFIKNCFTTRVGGVSEDVFKSMNLGLNRGDSKENVLRNYKILCDTVGFSYDRMVKSNQVHETDIFCVEEKNVGEGFFRKTSIKSCDGLITQVKNIPLVTFYADCVPLYFADVNKKVIAVSHAGWRGTVNGMASKTVERMVADFGTNMEDIFVGIGPSICQNCFEVDFPVYEEFTSVLPWTSKFIKEDNSKYYIDLWNINKEILVNKGVLEQNIEIANLCTKCNPELFYSHRVMGAERGSMVGIMELI